MIVAKPVVDGKFWILKDGEAKVGELQKSSTGFRFSAPTARDEFKTISMAEERLGMRVEKAPLPPPPETHSVSGYPTNCQVFNPVYDVKLRVPLFTKSRESKCWHAAGWYQIKQFAEYEWVQCPKMIILQRYPFVGPFKEKL